EFAAFDHFSNDAAPAALPDPNAEATFAASKLVWDEIADAGHREWHTLYGDLLEIRRRQIVPHLGGTGHAGRFSVAQPAGPAVHWSVGIGGRLCLRANFGTDAWAPSPPVGRVVYALEGACAGALPAWSALWTLEAVHA